MPELRSQDGLTCPPEPNWICQLPQEPISLDGQTWQLEPKHLDWTWLPEQTSPDGLTGLSEPRSLDGLTWIPEMSSLDGST